MTKTARQLAQDLIDHACSQLAEKGRQHVREGMSPASAASAAIRETKVLFPPDWRLAVQGGGEEDEVEVWEVGHKLQAPCARIVRETEAEARAHLVRSVKERARIDADPAIRRIGRWSDERVLDTLEAAMPRNASEAFRAVVARMPRREQSKSRD